MITKKLGCGVHVLDSIVLGDKVDITDPCYDRGSYGFFETDCKPGEYLGVVKVDDCGEWGDRVSGVAIFKDGDLSDGYNGNMKKIGSIGVDAGLAGFFNNKPDYGDDEWFELVDEMNPNHNNTYIMSYGICTDSGYGDGGYWVYANENRTAFAIKFIDDNDESVFYL